MTLNYHSFIYYRFRLRRPDAILIVANHQCRSVQ